MEGNAMIERAPRQVLGSPTDEVALRELYA